MKNQPIKAFTAKSGKKSPYLSVVLPVYNEEESLELQYKAVINAVRKLNRTFEIIFVNDGSTDRSPEILKSIAKKDKNVKTMQSKCKD